MYKLKLNKRNKLDKISKLENLFEIKWFFKKHFLSKINGLRNDLFLNQKLME